MESFRRYRGYGIRYVTFGGTTYVENESGYVMKTFPQMGEVIGGEMAEDYIDGFIEALKTLSKDEESE